MSFRRNTLSIGPKVVEFEKTVAKLTGRQHGIAVSSGTAGLHCAMLAAGIKPGDEVITTPFSFVASANCILYVDAKPVFVDIDPQTLNIDVSKVAAAITPQDARDRRGRSIRSSRRNGRAGTDRAEK